MEGFRKHWNLIDLVDLKHSFMEDKAAAEKEVRTS